VVTGLAAAGKTSAKYCIIGAGPAGIQLGQYFMHAGVDYATFERGEGAGMFFAKYPINRQLISVNKRSTRSSSKDFNLRHDWNSLLDTEVPPFTTWSEDYYPHADVLVKYLRAVAEEQKGNILYHHNVTDVSRSKAKDDTGFDVLVDSPSGSQTHWHCGKVIGAVGMWKPNVPTNWFRGLEHAVGYDELAPLDGKAFINRSVIILGNGNAAFEVADAVRNWASEIAIFGCHGAKAAKDTHYQGDIRGHRMTSADSLELKTLDDVYHFDEEIAGKLELVECEAPEPGSGQTSPGWPQGSSHAEKALLGFKGRRPLCVVSDYDEDEFLIADDDDEDDRVADALTKWKDHIFVRRISSDITRWNKYMVANHGPDILQSCGQPDAFKKTVLTMRKDKVRELTATSSEFRKALTGLLATTEGLWIAHLAFRKPSDVVIKVLGWKMESEPLRSLNIKFDERDKYPVTDACFRARDKDDKTVDGLYFAGTITHGFDKTRFGSAGGFIQGFRYTTDTLFRCLMQEVEKRPLWEGAKHVFGWNPEEAQAIRCFPLSKKKQGCSAKLEDLQDMGGARRNSPAKIRAELEGNPLWSLLMRRANEASGPYQMSCGALLDGIVYNKTTGTATYIENIPMDIFEENFNDHPRLVLTMRYGSGPDGTRLKRAPPDGLRSALTAWESQNMHPVFMFAQPSRRLIDSHRLHLAEDRWTDFAGREEVVALLHFLKHVEAWAWSGSQPTLSFHEQFDNLKMECTHHHSGEERSIADNKRRRKDDPRRKNDPSDEDYSVGSSL